MAVSIDKQLTALELARPYAELAQELAKGFKTIKGLQDKLATAKGGLWSGFKQALALGMAAGHTAGNINVGLKVACEEAKVPSGSFRSYGPTIGKMYGEIVDGTLTLAEAENMSIADARARYKKEKVEVTADSDADTSGEAQAAANVSTAEPANPLLASVMDRVKDWDDASLTMLLSIIADIEEQATAEELLEEAA